MKKPEITDELQAIVDYLFTHWAPGGEWPTRVHMKRWLLAQKIDAKIANSEKLRPLAYDNGKGFGLTFDGFACAEDAGPWLINLLALVQKGVEEFLKDPRGTPRITSSQLQEIAPNWDDEHVRRAAKLYREWLGGRIFSGGDTDDERWSFDVRVGCLHYRDIHDIWELLARLDSSSTYHRGEVLDDNQRCMASWILEKWNKNGVGPDLLDVILNHLDFPDPIYVWDGMPHDYFYEQNIYKGLLDPVRPRLKALLALCPHTDSNLALFARILGELREYYSTPEAKDIVGVQEFATATGISQDSIIRLLGLADSFYSYGVLLSQKENEWVILLQESILTDRGITTVEDLVDRFNEQEKKRSELDTVFTPFHQEGGEAVSGPEKESDDNNVLRSDLKDLALHPSIEEAVLPFYRIQIS